jgi:SAM-dependent methyltransferase
MGTPETGGSVQGQTARVQAKFHAAAEEWRDTYTRPRHVSDLVLADRKRWAVHFISGLVPLGSRVLDAGCGAGLAALDLVHAGYVVHGVDIAEKMIALANGLFADEGVPVDRYTFTCAAVTDAGLQDGMFGGIVALGFLQYQEEEVAALELFRRLLRPGGVLVVTGPTEARLGNFLGMPLHARKLLTRLRVLKPKAYPGRVGRHKYSVGRFRRLLRGAGFDVVEYKGHGFAEFDVISRAIGYRGELLLHRGLTALATLLPIGRWGNDLIFVARKPH